MCKSGQKCHQEMFGGGFAVKGRSKLLNVRVYMVVERAQRTATSENTFKVRKHLPQFDNTHGANAQNTTKKRNALQI